MYRRETTHRNRRFEPELDGTGRFKISLIKQTAACITILVLLIGIKGYNNPEIKLIENTVIYTVNETTNLSELWDRTVTFFKSLLGKEGPSGSDPLANLTAPVNGTITSGFGMRQHPVDNEQKFHYGVDIDAKEGDKIKAAGAGEVAEVGSDDSNGNYILVKHSDSIYTFYAHCEKTLPEKGDKVKSGQVIGTVGSTGKTTGPHLHFEIRDGDSSLDPTAFVKFASPQASPQPSN